MPIAARMARRSRLLTLILSRSRLAASPSAFAGQRIGERQRCARGLAADDDDAVGLAGVEVAFGQRLERGDEAVVAGGGDGRDRLLRSR